MVVNSEFMGKTFQGAQLTHERFLTIVRANIDLEYKVSQNHIRSKIASNKICSIKLGSILD